ncbi:galactose-1-phosphate uridylyltransferase, partial [bacterium]
MNQSPVWEQRWHPLRREWVLYTAHRGGRPWIGDRHPSAQATAPSYDPTCALCPGNARIHGENPKYTGVYCFTNDLPPLGPAAVTSAGDDFYIVKPVTGTSEVVCYSPDHAKTFVDLTDAETADVVSLWRQRTIELGARPDIDHVFIFENKGSLVGTSNPHPH